MGILRINGTIDIKQFWPVGSSDADTTKIKLAINRNSFQFQKAEDSSFDTTNAFDDAISRGQGSKPVINTKRSDGTKSITVRLQGVDAPELHYKAAPLKNSKTVTAIMRKNFNSLNKERRQCFAESATFALAQQLEKYANFDGIMDAYFETRVENPNEVVDTYGRFIGNIIVNKKIDINLWLVENGWAFPTFYTSMSEDEIQMFLTAWKKGKKIKNRPGTFTGKDTAIFDWNLFYREPSSVQNFKLAMDKGKVLMPKIFRRQVAWMVSKKAKVISNKTGFKDYLQKSKDELILLTDFFASGIHSSPIYTLDEFVSEKNKVLENPEQLVFREKPSTLVNSKGKKITKW